MLPFFLSFQPIYDHLAPGLSFSSTTGLSFRRQPANRELSSTFCVSPRNPQSISGPMGKTVKAHKSRVFRAKQMFSDKQFVFRSRDPADAWDYTMRHTDLCCAAHQPVDAVVIRVGASLAQLPIYGCTHVAPWPTRRAWGPYRSPDFAGGWRG